MQLEFGDDGRLDASLSERARGLIGSEILKIAAEIRQLVRSGRTVCNLTVGDFNARHFPIPRTMLEGITRALGEGHTNYPPSDGVLELREAVREYVARERGVEYPLESILIAGGARPILYAAYRCVLDPGDKVIYSVPSWNNNHYTWIAAAHGTAIATRAADAFMPTLEALRPHLRDARLLCLNSPSNPTGTVIGADVLRSISEAVVEENRRRRGEGRPYLFLLYDEVYGSLVFGDVEHHHPCNLVPESAPWVIALDGVSKAFAGTGLRVGWLTAAPPVTKRLKDLIGHMGAWAPRAEQIAVAAFLRDADTLRAFRREMTVRVRDRLDALYGGFTALGSEGYPVECISPQGAIYLSLRIDAIGRTIDGVRIDSNESLRRVLLDRAGLAVVPFQAFGLAEDSGWFRISVGAVSLEDIEQVFPRLRALLDDLS